MLVEWVPLLQILGPIVGAIATGVVAYFLGRKKNVAEIEKLQGEKKNVEAAAGLSTAEAASIISRAAADVVQPLTNRIRELQEDARIAAERHAQDTREMARRQADLEAHVALITKENIALKAEVAHLKTQIALLQKPHESANGTIKRMGEF